MLNNIILSDPVERAIKDRRPVVALESTIIAHGLPHPQNLETASSLEDIIRAGNAEPATVAVIDGKIRVGLTPEQLSYIASHADLPKLSRRDLPVAVAQQISGATTVAATMIAAAFAGIQVFSTGGIGGVHRGAEESFDISADLAELAQSPVCVVCAGVKAILDLAKTLEYLETMGVPVVGFGTDELPAFYCRESGIAVPIRCDTPRDVAKIFRAQRAMDFAQGLVVAVPPPHESALEQAVVEPAIRAALESAREMGIEGKDLTPFLLQEVVVFTEGTSLQANIALARNNAMVAAQIAHALAAMEFQ